MLSLLIARHQLLRVVRNPGLVIVLAAIPVTLALIEYAAFGPTVASGKLPPIRVLVLDEDQTFLSRAVPQVFTGGGPLKDMFETAAVGDRQTARQLFQHNQASALVVVPRGFQEALLTGGTAELQFTPNPIQTYSPAVARSVLDMMVLVGNGLYRNAAEPLRRINALRSSGQQPTGDAIGEISRGFFEASQRLRGLGSLGTGQLTVVRPTGRTEADFGRSAGGFFAIIFPGLVIFGLMFISQALAVRLMRDRLQGLDRRVSIAPISPGSRHAGALLFFAASLLALLFLLMIVGTALFQIELRNPAALIALALGFALFTAGFHLTIVGIAKDDRSASFIGSALVLVLSLLGGSFVPSETFPPFLQAVAHAMPTGATQQGLVDLLAHGKRFPEVARHVAVAWSWAAVALASAMLALRRAERPA